jgi:hypothetical protein
MFWSAGGRHEISKFATSQSKILPFVAVAAIRTSHAASPRAGYLQRSHSSHSKACQRFESLPLSFHHASRRRCHFGRSPQAGWNRAAGKGLIPRNMIHKKTASKLMSSLN